MKETPCIRIGHMKIIDHLILGIAGIQLKNQGSALSHCTIEAVEMNSWSQLCEALASGDIQAAFINAPLAMDLFSSGLSIRLLMMAHRGGSMIVKKKDSSVRTINDFKGKTVLVPSEISIQTMLLHRLFSSKSLQLGSHDDPEADVMFEVINPYLMPRMLAEDSDNDVAGFAVSDPYGSQSILEGTAAKICTSDDLWKSHPCCVFVAHTDLIKTFSEAFQEITTLFISIARKLEQKESDTISKAAAFLSIDKKITKKILADTAIKFEPDQLIPEIDSLGTIAGYMQHSMALLDREIDFNVFVDDSFILNSIAEKASFEN